MINQVKILDRDGKIKRVIKSKQLNEEFDKKENLPECSPIPYSKIIICEYCKESTKVFSSNAKYCQPPEKRCAKLAGVSRTNEQQKEQRAIKAQTAKRNCRKCKKAFKPVRSQKYCNNPCKSPTSNK